MRTEDVGKFTGTQAMNMGITGPNLRGCGVKHDLRVEDTYEIYIHGSIVIERLIYKALSSYKNFRLAEPGEFTKRAYLNGKIDLVQAEAIAEMISAKSLHAIKLARKNLDGNLSSIISRVQTGILKVRAKLEVFVDFPEDDIGSENYTAIISLINDSVV